MGVSDIGAADNQRVQAFLADLLERFIVSVDMRLSFRASLHAVNRERMDMKLGDLVAGADQTEKLPFRGFQGGVGHNVQQADMQFAYRLMPGSIRR